MKNMNEDVYAKWLNEFNATIDSPTPRRTTTPLRRCVYKFPTRAGEAALSHETLGEILDALLRLRHSRCAARLETEVSLMDIFTSFVMCLGADDEQNDLVGESNPDSPSSARDELSSNLEVCRLLGEYAFEAVKDKPKGETKTSLRVGAAFELLAELLLKKGLEELFSKIADYARNMIRKGSGESLVGAVTFVDLYYVSFKEVATPEDFIEELSQLERRTKNRKVAFTVNDTLVEIGAISKLAALDRMERF